MSFFSEFHWHDFGLFGKRQDHDFFGKILARNLRKPRYWQQMKKSKILARSSRLSKTIQDLGKEIKTPSTGYRNQLNWAIILHSNICCLAYTVKTEQVNLHERNLLHKDYRWSSPCNRQNYVRWKSKNTRFWVTNSYLKCKYFQKQAERKNTQAAKM